MYYPYLRSKQFELIALREISKLSGISSTVHPIIEPVTKKNERHSESSLVRTIEMVLEKEIGLTVIINPSVGVHKEHNISDEIVNEITVFKSNNNIRLGVLLDSDFEFRNVESKLNNLTNDFEFDLIHKSRPAIITGLDSIYNYRIRNQLVGSDIKLNRYASNENNKILLSDSFTKLDRNSDYEAIDEEFFSDTHYYYEEDGYEGFGDYTLLPSDFIEKGFAPRAVAIHLSRLKKQREENDSIFVKHFVSDSNETIADVAGKYGEALNKLVQSVNNGEIIRSKGVEEFLEDYEMQKYPGLGTIKKRSIMHHIELMHKFLKVKIQG